MPGDEIDERGGNREERLDDREEGATHHRLPDLKTRKASVLAAVALDHVAAAVEHLRQQDAGDREGFFGQRGQVGQRLLGLPGDAPPNAPDAVRQVHEERHDAEGEQRQLPREDQHRDERAQDRDDVREHRRGRVRDHVLNAADVVLQPRLKLAGASGREEAKRHRLQMLEEPVAKVLHHPLADDGGEVRLHHADRRRDDGHEDHHPDEHVEQAQVRPAVPRREQRLVEDLLGEQRVDDPKPGGDQDQGQDERDPAAIRPEQAGDAPKEVLRRGGHSRQGYVRP